MELENKNFLQGEGSTHLVYIKRKRFGHGYVEVFKEYETTRKLKKLEWEKDAFLFFCPIFASDA